jgi:hypothetical protein
VPRNKPSLHALPKLTAVIEPVERDFSILADLDEVAVGISHVAAPFPALIESAATRAVLSLIPASTLKLV